MNQNISEQSEGNVKRFLVGKEWDGHKVGMAHDLLAEGLMTMSEPQTFTRAFGNEEYNMVIYGPCGLIINLINTSMNFNEQLKCSSH